MILIKITYYEHEPITTDLFSFRKFLSRKAMLVGFRILARGLSAVINFHNRYSMSQNLWSFTITLQLSCACIHINLLLDFHVIDRTKQKEVVRVWRITHHRLTPLCWPVMEITPL
jgi:hypothetical protein